MDVNRKSILYMISDEFGLRRDSTGNRLKLQKMIYLLQAYGLQLGYGFGWYKYGPYSKELVYDAYTVLKSESSGFKERTKDWEFGEETKKSLENFRKTHERILDNLQGLERLASVHFVYDTWCDENISPEAFVEEFKKYKTRLFESRGEIKADDIEKDLAIAKALMAQA